MLPNVAFLVDAPEDVKQLGQGDAAESWVQVAKTGTFKDPRYGTFKITKRDFARWMQNFQSLSVGEGRLGLPVDVDHSPEKKGDTEAVGWVKQLQERGDELWGRVEWNTLGKELVQDKRYAYISPSYSQDMKTESGTSVGTALAGIALTNRPFLQMATVNLSQYTFAAKTGGDDEGLEPSDVTDLDDGDMSLDDGDTTLAGAVAPHILDVSDSARQKHAVVVKKVGGKTKHMFPIPPGDHLHARLAKAFIPAAIKAGHITEAEGETVRQRADEVLGGQRTHSAAPSYRQDQMELSTVLTAMNVTLSDLGLDESADEATVLSKLAEHRAKAETTPPADGQVVLSADQVAELARDAAAGRAAAAELHQARFDRGFTEAQREGKVVLSQKDTFQKLFNANPDETLTLMGSLQPSVNMAPGGSGSEPADLDAESRHLAAGFTDTVTEYGIDQDALRLHAAAVKLEQARGITYEAALTLAEQGVGA